MLVGSNGSDYVDGGGGSDTLYGDGTHAEALVGPWVAGATSLSGTAPLHLPGTRLYVTVNGQPVGNTLVGADRAWTLTGLTAVPAAATVRATSDDGGDGEDVVVGGAGNDRIYGLTGEDRLIGGSGDDFLVGGAGDDIVLGGAGRDTLAVIERGGAGDYDRLIGGDDSDTYVFKGDWGIASLTEEGGLLTTGRDAIDLSASGRNQIFVLSDGSLFMTAGTVFNTAYDSESGLTNTSEIRLPDGSVVRLQIAHGDLKEAVASPGRITTELGFGLHQAAVGKDSLTIDDSAAVLKALAALPTI